MSMVNRIQGLQPVDVEIVRFLTGHRFEHFEAGPTLIADHINSTAPTVSRHLSLLIAAGFVSQDRAGEGRYHATGLGGRWIESDLSEAEVAGIEARLSDAKAE